MLYDLLFIAPIVIAGIAVLLAILIRLDNVAIGLIGSLAAVLSGAAGTFIYGQMLLYALRHVTLTEELFSETWRSMWYPLATGLVIAIALTVYALASRNSNARVQRGSERRISTEEGARLSK